MGILSHHLKRCPIIARLEGGEKMGFFWRLQIKRTQKAAYFGL
jgi:hypothetical protein